MASLGALAFSSLAHATFSNVTRAVGIIDHERIERHRSDFVVRGGSPAIIDFNGDGWMDIYLTRYQLDDLLYLNKGGTFELVVNPLGLDTANGGNVGKWFDIDNDGDKDVMVVTADENRHRLYVNKGGGVFAEEAVTRGVSLPTTVKKHQGTSIAAGDINRDGYLDIVLGDWGVDVTMETRFEHYGLFLNQGAANPGHFTNITQSAGYEWFPTSITFYAPNITDLDGDGWPDIGTVVDFGKSSLHWNNADNTFTESTKESQVGVENHGMGTAIGDIDNDGDLDWFVTTIAMDYSPPGGEINPLYINQGGRLFENRSVQAGVDLGGWGWGTNMLDYDLDGDLDIAMVNAENVIQKPDGSRPVEFGPMILWSNDNEGETFTDVSLQEKVSVTGWAAGLVNFDYDNDGDQDLFFIDQTEIPVLLRNIRSDGAKWLRVTLEGSVSNRDGIGARVTAYRFASDIGQTREYNPTNAYLAQLEPALQWGFGANGANTIHRLEIQWPSGIAQVVENVALNQTLHIVEDESLLVPTTEPVFTSQPQQQIAEPGSTVSLAVSVGGVFPTTYSWYKNGRLIPGASEAALVIDPVSASDSGSYYAIATNNAGSSRSETVLVSVRSLFPDKSIARQWNELILDAVRVNFPDPTVVSRNLYHVSSGMWDAFWAYHPDSWSKATEQFVKETVDPASWAGSSREAAQAEAISHAVFRIVDERYKQAFNANAIRLTFRDFMIEHGYDPDNVTIDGDSPAAVGNRIGFGILAATLNDGSNEANNYADTTGYAPANAPMIFGTSGTTLIDPNRWQPLDLAESVTKNGIPRGAETQSFLTPQWNQLPPFALQKTSATEILIDPGPQPLFGAETEAQYISEAVAVIRASSVLDPTQGVMIDVSPGARQNNRFGTQTGTGRPTNPYTGQPYAPNLVNAGDYWRVTAEFWSDGPGIEGPPGVWNMMHNIVTDNPLFERRYGGSGPLLSELEWDVTAYLAINGALYDAGIAAWTIKAKYDSIRPMSMIRYLGSLGQSSDPNLPSYHASGLPLIPGLIELITAETVLDGQRHAHLAEHVGEIALNAWQGLPANPESEISGVGWIRADDWTPYHLRGFPTPNFAGYVSGHSTFSRAGAEVMTLLTGTPYFPGGLWEYQFETGGQLNVEYGPSQDLTVQAATYYDAADLTGVARIYCGVHIDADDFVGRRVGARIGIDAFLKTHSMRNRLESLGAIEKIAVRSPIEPSRPAPLVYIDYLDGDAPKTPIRIESNREAMLSAPWPGVYALYPNPIAGVTEFELLAKGRPIKDVNVRGIVSPDTPLVVEFEIESDEPAYLLAIAECWRDNAALEGATLAAYRIENGIETRIASNEFWHTSDTGSRIETLLKRENLDAALPADDAVALPLSLAPGKYKLQLTSTKENAWAKLRLALAR